jgi:hypothetical protein
LKNCTCTAAVIDPACPVGEIVGIHAPGNGPEERRRVPDRRRPRWEVFDEPVPLGRLHEHLGVRRDALPAGLLIRVRMETPDGGGERVLLIGSVNAIGGLCDDCACQGDVLAVSHDLVPLVRALGVPVFGAPTSDEPTLRAVPPLPTM